MNNVHRHLSFPISFVDNHSTYLIDLISKYNKEHDATKNGHYRFPLSKIPNNFSDWFHDTFKDIFIKDWEIFYTPPGSILPIHSDGYQPFINFVKLNYVFDGNQSTMDWYELKEEEQLRSNLNELKTPYTFVDLDKVNLIYQAQIGTPSLVNVGQLHGINNTKNTNGRWCICLIPNHKDSTNKETPRVLFDEALEIFKGYIQ